MLDGLKGPLRPAGRVSLPLAWPFVGTRFPERFTAESRCRWLPPAATVTYTDDREEGAAGPAALAETPARPAPGANP